MIDDDNAQRTGPGRKAEADEPEFMPPLEFGSIVVLLYFPALVELGLTEDPSTGERTENLTLAKRNIDLLDLLRDRTKGNLEEEEEKFLDSVLNQLKLVYLQKTDAVKT